MISLYSWATESNVMTSKPQEIKHPLIMHYDKHGRGMKDSLFNVYIGYVLIHTQLVITYI